MLSPTLKSTGTEHTLQMPSGSCFKAPGSWEVRTSLDYVQLTGPEKDLTAYFLELPLGTEDLDALSHKAWKKIDPTFSLPVLQKHPMPLSGGWDQTVGMVYNVPTSESRSVISHISSFQGHAYICLVEGTNAGFSRRYPELNRMVESWKPVGFAETNLNNNAMRQWSQADIQEFERFVSDAMTQCDIPGASIAIIKQDGQIIYQNGFGVKQLGTPTPVSTETPFMIGSTTKPLTSLLIAALVSQHKITWETPITHIFPDFKLADPELTQALQMHHTMSASTGMPARGLDYIFKHKGVTPEDRLAEMKSFKPTTKLGETFQYSNHLVMLGGYAAAHADFPHQNLETAYANAMQRNIFDPLGMKNTVLKAQEALALGAAMPHTMNLQGQLTPMPLHWENSCYSVAPAGAVWSTVEDLSQYLLLEMNHGKREGQQIINENALLERRKPGVRIGDKSSYGLGLFLNHQEGLNIIGHGGNTLGFSSDLFFIPEKGIGMVVLTNAMGANSFLSAVRQKFLELTFSAKPQADKLISTAVEEKKVMFEKIKEPILVDEPHVRWIDSLIGDYESTTLGKAIIVKTSPQAGYRIQFDEWSTPLGCEIDSNGQKYLVPLEGPLPGVLKLSVEDNGNALKINVGQEQHGFKKKCNPEILHAKHLSTTKSEIKPNNTQSKFKLSKL